MELGTRLFLLFFGISYLDRVSSGSCNMHALIACTQIISSPASDQVALRIYTQEELDNLCSYQLLALTSCLEPIRADCDVTLTVGLDAIVDTLRFSCSTEGRQGYMIHGPCLKQDSVQTDLKQCLTSHQIRSRTLTSFEEDYATVMCRLEVEYTACLGRSVDPLCGPEAARWVQASSEAASKAVSAMLACPQGRSSSPVRPISHPETLPPHTKPTVPTSVDCSSHQVALCLRPLEQLTPDLLTLEQLTPDLPTLEQLTPDLPTLEQLNDNRLQRLCLNNLTKHTECVNSMRPICTDQQLEDVMIYQRAFTAACQEFTKGDTSHRSCWKKDVVQKGTTLCARHHLASYVRTINGEDKGGLPATGWCRITQDYLDCVVAVIESHCPSGTSLWLWKTTTWILQPTSMRLHCNFTYTPPQTGESSSNIQEFPLITILHISSGVLACILLGLVVYSFFLVRTRNSHPYYTGGKQCTLPSSVESVDYSMPKGGHDRDKCSMEEARVNLIGGWLY